MSLNCQLAKKDYLQINSFLASAGRVEKNLEALQMKAIASLGGGAIGGTLSSINESLGGSHHVEQWQEIGLFGHSRPDFWDVNISLSIWSSIAAAQSSSSRVIPVVEWIPLKWGNGHNAGEATLQHSTAR